MASDREDLQRFRDMDRMAQLEAKSQAGAPHDKVAAFGQGLAQGGTLGYANELQAATYSPMAKLANLLGLGDNSNKELEAQGFKINQPEDTYASRLKENQMRDAALKQSGFYTAGQVVGGLTAAAAPGAGLARAGIALAPAGGLAANVARGALAGGAEGLVRNTGQDETRLGNAGAGALFGGALPAATGAVSAIGKKAGNLAEEMAFKLAGGMKRDFLAADKKGSLNTLGRYLIDNGYIKPGASTESILEKSGQMKSSAWDKLDQAYQAMEDQANNSITGQFDKTEVGNRLRTSALNALQKGELQADIAKAAPRVEDVIAGDINSASGETIGPRALHDFRKKVDAAINYGKTTQDLPAVQKGLLGVRNESNKLLEEKAAQASPEVAQMLNAGNAEFAPAAQVHDIAQNRVAGLRANNSIGLTDTILGAGLGTAGAVIGARESPEKAAEYAALGLGGAAASKLIKKYGPALTIQLLERARRAGPVMNSIAPETLGLAATAANPWNQAQ